MYEQKPSMSLEKEREREREQIWFLMSSIKFFRKESLDTWLINNEPGDFFEI